MANMEYVKHRIDNAVRRWGPGVGFTLAGAALMALGYLSSCDPYPRKDELEFTLTKNTSARQIALDEGLTWPREQENFLDAVVGVYNDERGVNGANKKIVFDGNTQEYTLIARAFDPLEKRMVTYEFVAPDINGDGKIGSDAYATTK